MQKIAPLKSSFMLFSILGLIITVIYTLYGRISETWGTALAIVFGIMFVASLRSMTHANIDAQLDMEDHMSSAAKAKHRGERAKRSRKKSVKKKSKKKK